MNPPLPMTSAGKGDHPTRFETAFTTMVSPNTAIVKKEERTTPKPTHSRKPTWPEETAFSQIEYAEWSSNYPIETKSKLRQPITVDAGANQGYKRISTEYAGQREPYLTAGRATAIENRELQSKRVSETQMR